MAPLGASTLARSYFASASLADAWATFSAAFAWVTIAAYGLGSIRYST
jgi:hypothetical protein